MATWPMLIKPKNKGGLGILNLYLQNDTLLLKHLHKFYTKQDIHWVNLVWSTYYSNNKVPHATREVGSFWWKDVFRLNTLYRGVAHCNVGDESTVLFWEDTWSSDVLANSFPRLFSFAKNEHASVKSIMESPDLASRA